MTSRHLERLRAFSRFLDTALQVPGTRFRLGFDPLLGLIPGFGDAAGGLIAAYTLFVAQQAGAPRSVLLRMLWNTVVDTIVGAIPFAGDLFDAAFKANVRNVALLEEYLASPQKATRSSWLFLAAVVLVALGVVALGIWAAIRLLKWIF